MGGAPAGKVTLSARVQIAHAATPWATTTNAANTARWTGDRSRARVIGRANEGMVRLDMTSVIVTHECYCESLSLA